MKKAATFIILVAVLISLGYAYYKSSASGTQDSIEFIAEHIDARGRIVDFQGEILVESEDDIKWYDTGDEVKIKYGAVSLKWDRDDFLTKETQQQLKRILVEYKYNKEEDKIRVFWRGKEVPRYVET